MTTRRIALWVLVLVVASGWPGTLSANERISHSVNGSIEVWRIDEPNVKQPETDYRGIRFRAGDRVIVSAGGGVQTGGSGRTWKLYVDPRGPKADRLYHGLIWIPGVSSQLVRIQSVVRQQLTVRPGAENAFLKLGYEDDGYGDNGYWGHDDGTDDQCKGVGPAWVMITVTHQLAAQPVVIGPPTGRGPIHPIPTNSTTMAHAAVEPVAVAFQTKHAELHPAQKAITVEVFLIDENGNKVSDIHGTHSINLSCLTDPQMIEFKPSSISLSQKAKLGTSTVTIKALPAGGEIQIQAQDDEKDLVPGSETISLQSRIYSLKINGATEARCLGGHYSYDLLLTDKEGHPLQADWDRKITLTSSRGLLNPTEVVVKVNEDHATVMYTAPWGVGDGKDKIMAQISGLEPAELPVAIVMSAYVLVTLAALGGILGGLARELYKGQFKQIMPRLSGDQATMGTLGNALFASLFGVVLFQAANLGLVVVSQIPKLAAQGRPAGQTLTFAFFFGVLGGFGGIVILARLLDKVLPQKQISHAPRPTTVV